MNDELSPPAPAMGPPPTTGQPARQLRRVRDGSIAGLAEGVGRYFGIDPNLVRIGLVVTTLTGGIGILAYLAGWFLIPEEGDEDPRPVAITKSTTATIIGSLILIGGISVLLSTTDLWIDSSVVLAGGLVALGIYLLNQRPDNYAAAIPTANTGGQAQPAPSYAPQPAAPQSTSTSTALVPASGRSDIVDAEPPTAQYWAAPKLDPADATPPPPPAPPGPPIAAVTTGGVFVVVGALLVLRTVFGLDIGATAMAGAAAAVVGAGFIARAFLGRSRGLGLLGFLAVLGLIFAPLADTAISGGVGQRTYAPSSVADLETFGLGMGDMLVDLTNLPDGTEENIDIELGAGAIEVVVPFDATVIVTANSRFGYVELVGFPGADQGGIDAKVTRTLEGTGDSVLTIDATVTFGYVEVRRGA